MLRRKLEAYFEFEALGATWKTEILAGFTTFMTMSYIVFVNPSILHETGMPLAGVTAATCHSAEGGQLSDGRLGALSHRATALALLNLILIAALLAWRVRAAMLIGILATTVVREI
jgi:adenine/guanine/hypoxanthine permease